MNAIHKRIGSGNLLLVMLFLVVTIGCMSGPERAKQPEAIEGVLDLSRWDFKRDGPVYLSGQWDFYWNEFIDPHEISAGTVKGDKHVVKVPNKWNNYTLNGKKLSGYGYGTYHLKILLPEQKGAGEEPPVQLALKLPIINTAYRLFVDGKELSRAGNPGRAKYLSVPGHVPGVVDFTAAGDTVEIIIHVSNYHYRVGGMWLAIELGSENEVREVRERIISFTLFLFGSIFIMALYHLGLFLVRRKDVSPLYFGLFCLLIAGFTLSMGERYIAKMIPVLNWYHVNRMQFFTHYAALPMLLLFIYSLYPEEFTKKILNPLITVCGIFVILVLVTPATIYSYSLNLYHPVTIIGCLQILHVLIRALIKGRDGSGVFLAGFIFLFITILLDMSASFGKIIIGVDMAPFGLFIFIFSQAYLLSHRFSKSLNAEENLSNELKKKNIELDEDIEERKRVEGELVATRNFLKNILDSLSSMLITVDREGAIIHWNSAAEKLTGISETEALSGKIWDRVPFLGNSEGELREIILSRASRSIYLRDGDAEKAASYILVSSPLKFGGLDGAVIRIDDVTEIMKKDEQLRQAQKMESVGTLAGGLAHDFNNILGGISGATSLLKMQFDRFSIASSEINELFDMIKTSSVRARDMVMQLLTLSRKYEFSFASVDLNDTVRHVVRICRNTFDKAIEIKMLQYPERAMVKADPVLLEQVVLNLCINASHAMTIMRHEDETYGGTLAIAINRVIADRHFMETHPDSREGEYWSITHHDTGVGIEQKLLAKIFDPFFTTKMKDKGSGLGLSMAYNIIRQHDGFIDVYSEPGTGSSFIVYLPVLKGEPGESPELSKGDDIVRGSGLVLIIDDEEIMRKTGSGILIECGYDVITAPDGLEGCRQFEGRKDEIRAVILDMIMPRMSGKEAFVQIKKINPRVPVIISSGFRMDERVKEIMDMGAAGFIQKPYSAGELSRIVAGACNG